MTKQDYTLYTYKADKRAKTGERLENTRVLTDMTEREMKIIVSAAMQVTKGYRFEFFPTMKTVKNLMTGKDIQIASDTPWCCNPASESYWSM